MPNSAQGISVKLEKGANCRSIGFLYLEENFKTFLTALMWTYQNLGSIPS